MTLNIGMATAAVAAVLAVSACGDDTATTGSSGASGSSTASGSTATTANTSTTNGSSGLATMGGSSATVGATDTSSGTTASADSSGTTAADSSSGGGGSSGGSSGEGESSSSTSEGEVDSGPMCSAEGMSCATGETCCPGLNCCGGVPVPPGAEFCGAMCPISDYRRKREFAAVDPSEVLDKVAALPITTWSYRHEDAAIRHIGPMAQDFMASFEVGASDESIFVVDADGVSLAAIQALYSRVRTAEQENKALRRTVDALEQRLAALEAR